MGKLETWVLALIIVALVFVILGVIYFIISQRRKSIVLKKVDYLVEDITYKSENLNSTVDTVKKFANYVDIFEAFSRKNLKSLAKVMSRNKDDIYKILNRIKKLAIGPEEDKDKETRKDESKPLKKKNNKKGSK